jgi:hypothetical protein
MAIRRVPSHTAGMLAPRLLSRCSGVLVRKKTTDPLQEAFEKFGLDPSKPEDRDKLLELLAGREDRDELLQLLAGRQFGPRKIGRPRGAKGKKFKKWSPNILAMLGLALESLARSHPGLSDAKLAKMLKDRVDDDVTRSGSETLRKQFAPARRAYKEAKRRLAL